jgi:acetate---CoA ligase (ADP-forming)
MASIIKRTLGVYMETMFFPHSVAIIGVSDSPSNVARGIIENLDRFAFNGKIYLVGSKTGSLLGRDVFADVSEIPEVPDMAVILIPARGLPKTLEACGEKGIGRIVIESGGFSEFGEDREGLEKEILKIAVQWGMKIIGPNCVGIVNIENGLALPFYSLYPHEAKKGPVSIIAQSGGLLHDIMMLCHMANIGVNKLVSIGNKLVIDENDLLEYLISDPTTGMIGLYLEDICDGRRLMDLAAGTDKPVVLLKSNRSPESGEIARFHTSALAGDDRIIDEAMKQAGVHRVESLKEMTDSFKAFSLKPLKGRRLAVVTRSGGHAVLAADSVYRHGFKLASFSEEFFSMLSEKTRAGVIRRTNPVDLGDVFDFNVHLEIAEGALREDGVDGVVIVHSYALGLDSGPTRKFITSIAELSEAYEKPIMFCMSGHKEDWFTMREATDLPIFVDVDEALTALRQSYTHYRNLTRDRGNHSQIIESIEKSDITSRLTPGIMPINEAFDLISTYGLTVADYRIVKNVEEGLKAAREIGYPLALKTASLDVLHKTEHGAVLLDIENEEMLAEAFQRIQTGPYLIQRMAPVGCEMIIGGRSDPEFGPVILCGSGGIFVEVYDDVAIRVAPINEEMARQMIEELKGAAILKGFRGRAPYDVEDFTRAIVNISRLLTEHPEIKSLDINPFILLGKGQGGVVVDARFEVE